MPQEYIEIRGARENNLKSVSLRTRTVGSRWMFTHRQ